LFKGLKNVRILTPTGYVKGNLEVNGEVIQGIHQHEAFDGLSFKEEVTVVPGFIDEHIHGVNSSDAMDATIEALANISSTLAKEGTTSFLATTMTQSVENISKAVSNVKSYMTHHNQDGAEVIGIHLEGPYLNCDACGAQPREYIVNPSVEQFKMYQELSGNAIKYVTIAPETEHGYELIQYCKEHDIVASIGHTKAKYDDAVKAIEHGATNVTHCYNAMTGLHHREPGVVGATMLHDELMAEMIVDGIHVHPKSVLLMLKNKTVENITLVTDSMRAKGLPDGEYELGGQKVNVRDGQARLEDGTLAGSVLKMIDAVNNMIEFTNVSLEEAVQMASTNPAKKLGVFDKKGSIEVNKDADLVVLNSNNEILMTICRGKIVYQK
jgi:N-acetylglucosamine-6-phosphate deacetylase